MELLRKSVQNALAFLPASRRSPTAMQVLSASLDAVGDSVVRLDARGCIQYFNRAAAALLGLEDAALDKPFDEQVVIQVNDETGAPRVRLLPYPPRPTRLPPEAVLLRPDGELLAIEGQLTPFEPQQGSGALLVMRDVSEQRRARRWMAFQATHDGLTALLNRTEIEKRIAYSVAQARSGGKAALLHVDLDQFKIINDTCGYHAGDEFLRRTARTLNEQLRGDEALARLGGDEFLVLVPGHTAVEVSELAERLIRAVKDIRFVWDQHPFRITASIGIVEIDARFRDWRQVLALADSACFMAKEHGRARAWIAREDDELLRRRRAQMDWVARITGALEEDRLVLFRQHITPLSTHATALHHEVLTRLREEGNVLAPPEQFIPAAERYGLMPAVDRRVVECVLRHLGSLPSEHADRAGVTAVNVSGTTLSDKDFVSFISDALSRHRVNPRRICFEITETAAATDFDAALRFINAMRRLGCQISLDDFGSGFSSFSYLKAFRADYLKIDGAFVRDMDTDRVNAHFVASINQLGKSLGLATIAEYAESAPVLDQLRHLGVDFAQGNYIGRPQHWIG